MTYGQFYQFRLTVTSIINVCNQEKTELPLQKEFYLLHLPLKSYSINALLNIIAWISI